MNRFTCLVKRVFPSWFCLRKVSTSCLLTLSIIHRWKFEEIKGREMLPKDRVLNISISIEKTSHTRVNKTCIMQQDLNHLLWAFSWLLKEKFYSSCQQLQLDLCRFFRETFQETFKKLISIVNSLRIFTNNPDHRCLSTKESG